MLRDQVSPAWKGLDHVGCNHWVEPSMPGYPVYPPYMAWGGTGPVGCVFMEKERDGAASQGRQPVDGRKDGDQCFPTCSHCSRHIPLDNDPPPLGDCYPLGYFPCSVQSDIIFLF